MKVCLYAGDMNLNRNNDKKYVEIQKKIAISTSISLQVIQRFTKPLTLADIRQQ